jgi:hypothetical protein
MSCKHEFTTTSAVLGEACYNCGISHIDYLRATVQRQAGEIERKNEAIQHWLAELYKTEQERDQLQAQVDKMRGTLTKIVQETESDFEPLQRNQRIKEHALAALSTATPATQTGEVMPEDVCERFEVCTCGEPAELHCKISDGYCGVRKCKYESDAVRAKLEAKKEADNA